MIKEHSLTRHHSVSSQQYYLTTLTKDYASDVVKGALGQLSMRLSSTSCEVYLRLQERRSIFYHLCVRSRPTLSSGAGASLDGWASGSYADATPGNCRAAQPSTGLSTASDVLDRDVGMTAVNGIMVCCLPRSTRAASRSAQGSRLAPAA
eukprot:5685563-Pyramimonas_sp.AAC.3